MSSAPSTDTIARRERFSLGSAIAGPLLCTGGAGLALLAVAVQMGVLQANTWPMRALIAAGFDIGTVTCTAVVLFGLGVLAFSLRSYALSLARRVDPVSLERTLDERLEGWQGTMDTMHSQQQVLQGAYVALDQKLEAMRQEARTASAKDAIFRLAASLDQLGARIEQRLSETRGSLQDAIQGVGDSVETTRNELGQRFQETIRSIGTLSAEETLAGAYDETFRYAEQGPETLGERSFREEAPRAGEMCLEVEHDRTQSIDLGVLGTITDEPNLHAALPAPAPAARTESSPEPRALPVRPPLEPRVPPSPLPNPPRKESPAPLPAPPRQGGALPLPRLDERWGNPGKPARGS